MAVYLEGGFEPERSCDYQHLLEPGGVTTWEIEKSIDIVMITCNNLEDIKMC